MRAELKRLHSPDVDLASFIPDPHDNFSILLQAMIGIEGSPAEESFDFIVCTPQWLKQKLIEMDTPIFGADYIIVKDFNAVSIERAIAQACSRTKGTNWHDIAIKLSRFGHWEFSDYQA